MWLNADALYTQSDGTTPGDIRGLFPDGEVLYTAGHIGEQAVVWRNGELLYTLDRGEAYAMYVVPHYGSAEE